MRIMIFQFSKKTRWDDIVFSMEYHVYWLLKRSCFETFGDGKYGRFLEPKSWWKYDVYWLLQSSCSELFGDGKYYLFLSQRVDGKMIFTDYWKVHVLNFLEMGNMVCFWAKKLMERWYLLGLFELSMIYQDLGNMVFRAVNHFNIYLFYSKKCKEAKSDL